MKRSPLARGKPLGHGKPLARGRQIRTRSDKRTAEDGAWRDCKMRVDARDGGRCQAEALVPEVPCGGRLDPHHVWPTGQGGPRTDPANVVTACRSHHDWIHAHTRQARERGLLI